MIEYGNTGELLGQTEMMDFMGQGNREQGTGNRGTGRPEEMADGYDAEGNLLNVDWPPIQGTGKAEEPQTSAEVEEAAPEGERNIHDSVTDPGAGLAIAEPGAVDRLAALAVEINAITEQTRGVVISAALAVGKRLIEAKSLCPAGRFGEWLEKSVSYSERKAQDMMRLYVEYGRDGCVPDSIAALDYSKAVALLGAPAEARERLAEKAAEEDLSVRQLQAEVTRLKAEKARAQMTIEDMEDKIDRQKAEITRMDDDQQKYDRAIVEQEEALKKREAELKDLNEALRVANAKVASAEAAAEELRKMRSEAEDRAAASAQRAADAVNRANQAAKDLGAARAKIEAMEEAQAAGPETVTVEVIPDSVKRELADLRTRLAAANQGTGDSGQGTGKAATAAERFKMFYDIRMKPAFSDALSLLTEVAREDAHTADMFATALVNGCRQLMTRLGKGVGE